MITKNFSFKGLDIKNGTLEVGSISISESHDSLTFIVNYRVGEGEEILESKAFSISSASVSPILNECYSFLGEMYDNSN